MRALQGVRCRLGLHEWGIWEVVPEKCESRRVCRRCDEVETVASHDWIGCKCSRCRETRHDFVVITSWEDAGDGAWDSDFGSYDAVEVEHSRCRRCGTESSEYTGRKRYV